ncbi:MAG: hypothetical protein IJM90_02045 [Firmicutes bacterium]|nr:hypothetical protein [Bacillota bacterium]
MYCVKCGVELADTETKCPLCGTVVYHPDLPVTEPADRPLYPSYQPPVRKKGYRPGVILIMALICLLPIGICLPVDLKTNHSIVWSGYVIGGVVLTFIFVALPILFQKKHPYLLAALLFASTAGFLFYIERQTGGHWFLTLALPMLAIFLLFAEGTIFLLRRTKVDLLKLIAGHCVILGLCMVVLELLICLTFQMKMSFWSYYPLAVLGITGCILGFIAGNQALRESLYKKFFI